MLLFYDTQERKMIKLCDWDSENIYNFKYHKWQIIFFYSIIYIFKEQEFKIINFRDTLKLQENRNLNNDHNIRPKIKKCYRVHVSYTLIIFFFKYKNRIVKNHIFIIVHIQASLVWVFIRDPLESSQSSILLHVDDVGTARRSWHQLFALVGQLAIISDFFPALHQ